jgi:AcrR family transcriptional regulator
MNAQAKARSDDTRGRIIETAEALFRRLGYAKTAVADIAAELGMSPANVYRFFPSKNAIVEAICQRCLSEVEEKAWAAACFSISSGIIRKICLPTSASTTSS